MNEHVNILNILQQLKYGYCNSYILGCIIRNHQMPEVAEVRDAEISLKSIQETMTADTFLIDCTRMVDILKHSNHSCYFH